MSGYIGRVGVVIETAPGHFMAYRLRGIEGSIEHKTDYDDIYLDPSRLYARIPETKIRIEVEGYLEYGEHTAPPDWAEEPQGEIGARRELPAAPPAAGRMSA